jgi:hypothetical protein
MTVSRRVLGLIVAVLVAFISIGCGGSQKNANTANVKAGEMPEGSTWTGVYYSQTYGNLHLIEEGGSINGKWRTTNGDAWGELAGEADGDLLRYEWTEHKIGMVGPSATSKGKGYFKYVPSENGVDPDQIKGEWGLGEKEAGNSWEAVKQRNVTPDPDSVSPDELERRGVGGGWDDEGGSDRRSESDKAFGTDKSADDIRDEEREDEEEEEPAGTGPDSDY